MAILDTGTLDHREPTHHLRWFMIGGLFGLLIAIAAVVLWLHGTGFNKWMVLLVPGGLMLLPAMMEGSTGLLRFVVLAVSVMNFALWGVCFMIISFFVSFVRSFRLVD